MNRREFIIGHWNLFLTMEKELMNISSYISFSPENNTTFSANLLKCLLSIGAEFDVICKSYCKYLHEKTKGQYKYASILDYSFCFCSERPSITSEVVQLEIAQDYYICPLETWKCDLTDPLNPDKNCSPEWWWAYNKNKHERNAFCIKPKAGNKLNNLAEITYVSQYYGKAYFQTANLSNVINALASLFIIEMYFYRDLTMDSESNVTVPDEYSKLFYLLDWETHIVPMSRVIMVNSQMQHARRIGKADLKILQD